MFDYISKGNETSDLACERRKADTQIQGVKFRREIGNGFIWERLEITSSEAEKSIGRPIGNYDTLNLPRMDTMDDEAIEDAANEIAKELCHALDRLSLSADKILIVGLGNPNLTPDSIGPKTASMVNATMHIKKHNHSIFEALECSEIAVCTPGVMSQSGMEAADMIVGLCEKIKPNAVFAVDSLASKSQKRLGSTIQISDTGIFPGSGIGNHRTPLNNDTLGVPVIAIGVPTVINANHLLSQEEEIIKSEQLNMFVSPREIDGITDASSKIISLGINQAFGIF